MEITELMIGDLLFYMDGDTLVTVVVRKINGEDNVVCLRQSDGHKFNTMIDFLRPIPLTPDIFENNGFKQIGKKFTCGEIDDDLIEIIPSINNTYRITISVADLMISCSIWCSHVHQLQNALRLLGIKKELTLP